MKITITEQIESGGKAMSRTVQIEVKAEDSISVDYRQIARNLHTRLQELKYTQEEGK